LTKNAANNKMSWLEREKKKWYPILTS